MPENQRAAWKAVFDIHAAVPLGWVLVGGQAVYLHAVERGAVAVRATLDADVALDIRAFPSMLERFTGVLVELGFESKGQSPEGHQHRWQMGSATVDVLIPRHLGERAERRPGVTGGTTIAAPGTQQALDRMETVEVSAAKAAGKVNRPSLLGCLVGKAAAMQIVEDPLWERHVTDFLTLASVLRASDLRGVVYGKADREHLGNMLGRLAAEPRLLGLLPEGKPGLERLRISLRS